MIYPMKELIDEALNMAMLRGSRYADVRLGEIIVESVAVKNGQVEAVKYHKSRGIGIRTLIGNSWGFASTASLSTKAIQRAVCQAVEIAQANAVVAGRHVDLGSCVVSRGTYRTPIVLDPFAAPLEEKIALLMEADRNMRAIVGVTIARGCISWQREQKFFGNSEGAFTEQELVETGCSIEATAVAPGEVQNRSYPNSFHHQATRGYEFVVECNLPENAQRIGEEAVALLTAKQCPQDITTTVILDSSQLALQIHESCGHPVELDRIYGTELDYAGGSFLGPDKLNTLQYGSEYVNIYADATLAGGLGTFGYDDEGVPAQRASIIKNGILVGYLTSREFAGQLGILDMGAARAESWKHIPLVRMTNVSIEPGTWKLDDLIADTNDGIYMETNRSWSIDDQRLNFQFGTELAFEIKGGKRGALLKNATYTGITPLFWTSMDAICDCDHYAIWGISSCGKGRPLQIAHTSHGAAPARFRNVRVGVKNA